MLHLNDWRDRDISPPDPLTAHLLIVDDEPNIRMSLAKALTLLGHVVDQAASGQEALALLERTSPDLLLLDMNMPGLDGVEVMYQARRIHPDLAIIVLTGYATVENAIASVKLGATDYLRKPLSTREIARAVTQTLEMRATRLQQQHLRRVLGEMLEMVDRTKVGLRPGFVDSSPATVSKGSGPEHKQIIRVHPLVLDFQKRLVLYENHVQMAIPLTKSETAVLAKLMSLPNRVLSCLELAQATWGVNTSEAEAESIVRPTISRLRRKLRVSTETPELIHTVRREGYYFAPIKV